MPNEAGEMGSASRMADEDSRELKRSQAVARIAGVNIPTKKRVEIALTYIHGIGITSAKKICAKAGVPEERRVNDLSEEELTRLRDIIDGDQLVEGDLRCEVGACTKGERSLIALLQKYGIDVIDLSLIHI